MARRRNANLPGLRRVGTIPGYATEIQYLRNGRAAYYHPFEQPGRVRMIALSDGSVQLKGARRIHADDREPGFDRYTRRTSRRANPGGGIGMLELALLGAAAWFLLRSPADGAPNLLRSLVSSATDVLPAAAATSTGSAVAPADTVAVPSLTSAADEAASAPRWHAPFDAMLFGSGYYGAAAVAHPPN